MFYNKPEQQSWVQQIEYEISLESSNYEPLRPRLDRKYHKYAVAIRCSDLYK